MWSFFIKDIIRNFVNTHIHVHKAARHSVLSDSGKGTPEP